MGSLGLSTSFKAKMSYTGTTIMELGPQNHNGDGLFRA